MVQETKLSIADDSNVGSAGNKPLTRAINTRTKYVLVGSDFSQQEPRLLSHYSQDKNMITAYKQGKDLYATIASGVYKMGYWDCMEHHEDGSPNPEGKKRRQSVKAILLGRPKRFHCFHVKY